MLAPLACLSAFAMTVFAQPQDIRSGLTKPRREKGMSEKVIATDKSVADKWDDLYKAIEAHKQKNFGLFPVMIYSLQGQAKLPSFIFICTNDIYRKVVEGVLEAVLEPGWRDSGEYWITSKKAASGQIAKALGAAGRRKDIGGMIDADLSGGGILVYRYHRAGADADGIAAPAREGEEIPPAAPETEPDHEPVVTPPGMMSPQAPSAGDASRGLPVPPPPKPR